MRKINEMEALMYSHYLKFYMGKYGKEYGDFAKEYVFENFMKNMELEPDILKQIYSLFGMLTPEENYYLTFAKEIGKKYGWDADILEIGGGFYPAFSRIVDLEQTEKKTGGTITTYDPYLIINKLGNIKLHKEYFTPDLSADSYDVIVGIMPCDSTKLIIDKASESEKDFFIAMCGCMHPENLDPYYYPRTRNGSITYRQYINAIYEYAKEEMIGRFDVTLEEGKVYSYRYPVISSRKK